MPARTSPLPGPFSNPLAYRHGIAYLRGSLSREPRWPASSSPPRCPTSTGSSTSATWSAASCRPTSTPATCAPAATRSCSSAPPTSTAPRPSSPPPRPASRSPTTARGSGRCRRTLVDGFRLSFDHFGRSSSPQNHGLTQHFAGRLADDGLISEVREQQIYSPADGRFLPDRYVEGTCPHCGYPRARGDQCENCTKQLDPTDLIEPRSAISGSTDLEVRETKHLYLRQSLLRDELRAWIDDQDRLAGALHLDRAASGSTTRGPAGPRDHPRPRLGHPGPARRPSPGPAWRARSSTSGSTPRSSTSAPPPSGPTRTAAARRTGAAGGAPTRARRTSATSSSWARTTCPSTPSPSRPPSSAPASRGSSSTTSSPSTT